MRTWITWISCLLVAFATRGQDGSVDPTFQSPAFPLAVPMIAVEADGSVLCASANDGFHFTLTRLTSTGSLDASINIGSGPVSITPGIDFGTIHIPGATNPATIDVIHPLPDGRILVGGSFSHFNGVARKLLVRLNRDGSVDSSFNKGAGFTGDNVFCLLTTPEGTIYAGGKFSAFNGSSRNIALVRLTRDGELDPSFVDGTISFGASVGTISRQPDGKLLIDTAYANSSFQATRQVYRLNANGGLDSSFAQGAGTPAVAAGLRHGLMSNGQILVAGGSGLYNGATVNSGLFRLHSDGQWDSGYAGATLKLVNVGGLISRFLPAPDGSIYFNGAFDQVNGTTLEGLARLRADGSLDPTFVPAVFVSPAPSALARQPDGKLLVCSIHATPTGSQYFIHRLNASGETPVARPRLGTLQRLPDGVLQIPIDGAVSRAVILSSPDLTSWTRLVTNEVVQGAVSFKDPSGLAALARFYRLLIAP